MNWHERFKEMKKGLGYTNSDIAEITGNTADSIKSSTQPNKEMPRWLKLAIVVYESNPGKAIASSILQQQTKEEVFNFIRKRLAFKEEWTSQLRYIDPDVISKQHRRFDMSGYETKGGTGTMLNLSIVNEFADLGIYDYTSSLLLDFYKGTPTLSLKYLDSNEFIEEDFTGYGTVEIIYKIFERTIFSGRSTRIRT